MKRKFTGVWIPREIWEHQALCPLEKFLWAEIHSLDGEDGCFASNDYLANMVGCSTRRVQQMISNLKNMYLIKVQLTNNSERVIRMAISFVGVDTPTKYISPHHEINFVPPTKDISSIDNNKDNNKRKNKGKQVPPPSENDCIQFFQEKKFESIEGSKFFHYWESMDWVRPGGGQIQKWKSAANQWMLKSKPEVNQQTIKQPKIATL
jgi:hypothetical protein